MFNKFFDIIKGQSIIQDSNCSIRQEM